MSTIKVGDTVVVNFKPPAPFLDGFTGKVVFIRKGATKDRPVQVVSSDKRCVYANYDEITIIERNE